MKRLTDRFWPQAWSLSGPRAEAASVTAPIGCLPVLLLGFTLPLQAAGPTGHLNDTGQTRCLNVAGTALEACSTANSGDTSPYPRQDGRFGRDPAAGNPARSGFTKPAGSGGSGGFAFTPLDVNGNPIPLTGKPPVPSATPRCVWDRVTNLIWEVKTSDGGLQDSKWGYGWGANYTYSEACWGGQAPAGCSTNNYIIALNNVASVCPVVGAGPWRLPTRRELLSIVDFARSPTIDTRFFPNPPWGSAVYWSADVYMPNPADAWLVNFADGSTFNGLQASFFTPRKVRLVRNGQ